MRTAICGVAVAAMLSGGCIIGSAKIWSQDQSGGVLALEGDEEKAMQDAQNKMAQHCGPGNWQIVKRETIKVGEEQYSESSTDYGERTDRARDEDTVAAGRVDSVSGSDSSTSSDAYGSDSSSDSYSSTTGVAASSTSEDETEVTRGGSNTSSVQGVRDVNSVRIHYACGAGGPPPTAPAPAAPAPAPDGY